MTYEDIIRAILFKLKLNAFYYSLKNNAKSLGLKILSAFSNEPMLQTTKTVMILTGFTSHQLTNCKLDRTLQINSSSFFEMVSYSQPLFGNFTIYSALRIDQLES